MKHKTRIVVPAAVAALALGLGACGDSADQAATTTTGSSTTAAKSASSIEVKDPWARATIGSATASGVFMTLDNAGDTADALVGASVPATVARVAQVHETVAPSDASTTTMAHGSMTTESGHSGSMAGMREVEKVEIPAGSSVQLAPGGYHVMLIDLAKPLAVGDTFELTLTFEKAGSKTVSVTAKEM